MPEQLNLLRTFAIISAILNILYGLGWVIYTIVGGLVTCGFGCLFGIIPVINIISCVMDFIAYNKLNTQNRTGTYGSVQFAAIFDIVTIITGNVGSMAFGIIALVVLSNDEIKNYLRQKGIY